MLNFIDTDTCLFFPFTGPAGNEVCGKLFEQVEKLLDLIYIFYNNK